MQHLQRLSPQEWLLPIVVLGLEISVRTNRFLRLLGCLNATMGGSGKILDSLEYSCGEKRCKCCRHMQHSSSYTSKVTGKQYKIFCTVNCKSANIIYILECSVCGLQYVGESQQPFHKRLNGHRSDLTKKVISSCEPTLRTLWSQSRGFWQNENPRQWTELSL